MDKAAISESELTGMMRAAGLRPSVQRLAVLAYIVGKRSHPTPDEIYVALSPKFPSLSRTTVYNALRSLADAGLLRELDIEAGCQHYDFLPQPPHGHFVCRSCGRIYDMPVPADIVFDAMAGFHTETVDFRAKGLCPDCNPLRQTQTTE